MSTSTYALPELSYDYGALEPHISGRIMELHHDKHHSAYVKGANDALDALGDARERRDFSRIAGLQRALAFNLSGHVLHSLFWKNLTPRGGGQPEGLLAAAIDRDFGGFDIFKAQLIETAMTTMGSGWAVLCWEPVARCLLVTQIHDHQSENTQGSVPLLVMDAWEHAFYLQHGPDKKKYFQAIWNVWNWEDVARRFASAQVLDLGATNTDTIRAGSP